MIEFFANSMRDYVRNALTSSGVSNESANEFVFLSPDSENALCFKGSDDKGAQYVWYWKVTANLDTQKFQLHEVIVDVKNVAPFADDLYNYTTVQDVINHILENILTYIRV